MALGSRAYVLRIIYAVPVLCALAATTIHHQRRHEGAERGRRLGNWVALAACIWCAGISLIGRNGLALVERHARDPEIPERIAAKHIGAGGYRVMLDAAEFYYAGRKLGWHMYIPYAGASSEDLQRLRERADFAVTRADQPSQPYDEAGYDLLTTTPPIVAARTGYSAYAIYRRRIAALVPP